MRSKLNKFLDGCPKWVQDEVWGENGMRAEIEQLQQRNTELERERDKLKLRYEGKDLVWFDRSEVGGLDLEQTGFIDLRKNDAEVARKAWDEALDAYGRLRGCPILEDDLAVEKERFYSTQLRR